MPLSGWQKGDGGKYSGKELVKICIIVNLLADDKNRNLPRQGMLILSEINI